MCIDTLLQLFLPVVLMHLLLQSLYFTDVKKPSLNISDTVLQLITMYSNFSIKCLPEENNFKYFWERKDAELPLNSQGMYSSQLTIFNVKPKDSGEYRCRLSNSTGTIMSNFTTITVKGKYMWNKWKILLETNTTVTHGQLSLSPYESCHRIYS